jgi:hypothetical protein
MMRAFIPLLILFFVKSSHAQETARFEVLPGEVPSKLIGFQNTYRFADFRQGTIEQADGSFLDGLLNYHLLLREIQWINEVGDTIQVNSLARKITIGGTAFYEAGSNAYVEEVFGEQNLRLGIQRVIVLIRSVPYNGQIVRGVSNYLDLDRGIFPSYRAAFGGKAVCAMVFKTQSKYFFVDKNLRVKAFCSGQTLPQPSK